MLGPRPDPRDSLPGWRVSSRPSVIVKLTRVDWIGALFFTSGAILVLIGLSWGSTEDWNKGKVIATLTVGGILILIFVGWELYLGKYEIRFAPDGTRLDPEKELKIPPRIISHTNRMLPLWIFKNHQISIVFFSAFTGGMVMFGCLYFLAIYWSIVAGFENTKTGEFFVLFLPSVRLSIPSGTLASDVAFVMLLTHPGSRVGTQLVYLTPGLGGGVWISSAMIKWWRQVRSIYRSILDSS